MSSQTLILNSIKAHAQNSPSQIALQSHANGPEARLSYVQLATLLDDLVKQGLATNAGLNTSAGLNPNDVVATVIDNSLAWIVLDLALMEMQLPHIPLPAYFTDAQMQHALSDAGVTVLVCDQPERFANFPTQTVMTMTLAGKLLSVLRLHADSDSVSGKTHPQVAKITYTSGTTGQPKGVCLSVEAMLNVAQSICQLVQVSPSDQHLCILPLATLLENVAGVYASLLGGATVHVLPSRAVGFTGSQFEVDKLFHALQTNHATTGILIPELLKALMQWMSKNKQALPQLKFLAVGGAHVAPSLLAQAHALGLPVYEGYGLSEASSVVCLNTPQANQVGSVGRALPHVQMRLAEDGEIWVKGATLQGYTSQAAPTDADGFIPTGDLGRCDEQGFWHIYGRKKNMFITSFGRNVSPEWVESELTHLPSIAQACLFGEAQPMNVALLFAKPQTNQQQIADDIAQLNTQLPDYARISRWLLLDAPFTPNNGQLTVNGRLKRDVIASVYQTQIETLFS